MRKRLGTTVEGGGTLCGGGGLIAAEETRGWPEAAHSKKGFDAMQLWVAILRRA